MPSAYWFLLTLTPLWTSIRITQDPCSPDYPFPDPWFSSFQLPAELCELNVNFSIQQNHLEDLLRHESVAPTPIVSVSTAGVPNLWDLMPDNLRWRWCDNNGNKVHNECNALEPFRNHPPHPPHGWKKFSSMIPVPGAKNIGDHCSKGF